jgi:hypothetical protein
MKLCSKLLAIAIIASAFGMISCAGPASASFQNVTINLTYYPICNGCGTTGTGGFFYGINPPGSGGIVGAQICSPASSTCLTGGTEQCNAVSNLCSTGAAVEMPPGGGSGSCIELFVTVKNAPLNPTWTIYPAPISTSATSNVGTLSSQTGATNFYCEASSIPIYSGAQLAQAKAAGIVDASGTVVQGTTEVVVSNPADPANPSNVVSTAMFFTYQLLGPPTGINVGIFAGSSVEVPLSTATTPSTYQFTGWVAGVNGLIGPSMIPAYSKTWNLAACTGGPALVSANGTSNYGSINATTGVYTAPTAYPSATFHCANVTVTSAAYSTIISSVTTVNFP